MQPDTGYQFLNTPTAYCPGGGKTETPGEAVQVASLLLTPGNPPPCQETPPCFRSSISPDSQIWPEIFSMTSKFSAASGGRKFWVLEVQNIAISKGKMNKMRFFSRRAKRAENFGDSDVKNPRPPNRGPGNPPLVFGRFWHQGGVSWSQ